MRESPFFAAFGWPAPGGRSGTNANNCPYLYP